MGSKVVSLLKILGNGKMMVAGIMSGALAGAYVEHRLANVEQLYGVEYKLSENEVVKRNYFGLSVFPTTVLMDTNRDGECDKVRTFLPANRQFHLVYSNPTDEEKELYREFKTGERK